MRWLALTLTLLPGAAHASFVEVFDYGPAMGKAGAVAATEDGGAAAYYNPAGLAFRQRPLLRIGGQFLNSQLKLRNQRVPISRPFGVLLEAAAPVPLLGWLDRKIAVGVALHISPQAWLTVEAPASTEPAIPYYQNRSQRLVIMPGVALAFRPHPTVAIGLAVNYFAGVDGTVFASDGAGRDLQASVEEEFVGEASLHGGVRVQLDELSLALVYRGQFTVPVATSSNALLLDTPLALDIEADAMFTPETFLLGGGWRGSGWSAAADVSWRRWSRYRAPFSPVTAQAPVPLSPTGETFTVESNFERPETRDLVRVAVHGTKDIGEDWVISLGYGFEPSPFLEQSGPSNLVDGAKHILGLGLSWRGPPWGVDAATQLHWMTYRRLTKDPALIPDEDPIAPGRQTTNLGYPTVAGGGLALAVTLSLVMELDPIGEDEP